MHILAQTALVVGQTLLIDVSFNSSVTVAGGTPQLSMNVNGNTRIANYASGSGTDALRFAYTLQAGDIGANSATTSAISLTLPYVKQPNTQDGMM